MPESTRSSVVLPEPLWPTRPTRSPSLNSKSRASRAHTTGWLPASLPMVPPVVRCSTFFFNERCEFSKIGNSTVSCRAEMLVLMGLQPVSQTVARALHQVLGGDKAHDQETDRPHPGFQVDRGAQHRRPDDFDQVVERIEMGDPGAILQQLGRPHDGREEEGDLEEV